MKSLQYLVQQVTQFKESSRRVDKAIIPAASRFDGTIAFVGWSGEKGLRRHGDSDDKQTS